MYKEFFDFVETKLILTLKGYTVFNTVKMFL